MEAKNSHSAAPFRSRVSAARNAMKRENLKAILFYSSGQLSMLEVNPVLWISGVVPMGPHTGVLLEESGEPTMLLSLSWDQGRVRERTCIGDVRVVENLTEEMKELFRGKGIKGEVGIDALPSIERAAEIADVGFSAILEKGRVGMLEHELAAEVEYEMRSQGANEARPGLKEYEIFATVDREARRQGVWQCVDLSASPRYPDGAGVAGPAG